MSEWYDVELHPQVEKLLDSLSSKDYKKVRALGRRLAAHGTQMSGNWWRDLGDDLFELRIALTGHRSIRITFWFAPERRIVLLTWFDKSVEGSQNNDVKRARAALRMCREQHAAGGHDYRNLLDAALEMDEEA